MRTLRPTLMTIVALAILYSVAGAVEKTAESRIESVVVYPDRAKITRTAVLTLEAGTHTVTVENLPGSAFEESIRAAAFGVEGMTFLGLTHAIRQHLETPETKLADLRRELDRMVHEEQQVASDRLATLEELKRFVSSLSAGAKEEMQCEVTDGKIDVAQWSAAYDFLGEKSFTLADSIRNARHNLAVISKHIGLLRERIAKLQTGHSRTTRTVSIDLELVQKGKVDIEVEYIVPDARWRPLYDARLGSKPGEVQFTYHAEVSQKTGEDWDEVNLALSTALPSVGAGPGQLSPWFLYQPGTHTLTAPLGGAGEITGRLTDRQSGRPIVGASVHILGTNSGAMSDRSGQYRIVRVAPGSYTLRISQMNYVTTEVTDVRVSAGERQVISQPMTKKAADLDGVISVVGYNDILDKFVVDSRVSISEGSLAYRPNTSVDYLTEQVTGLQTTAEREVFVRGGRAGDVAYIIDGAPIDEPLGGRGNDMALVSGTIINSGSYPALFKIKRPETIPSGAEDIRVIVAEWNFEGEAKLVSRPRNREGAYRLVELSNQNDVPLTPAKVAIFAGTHFVGHAQLGRLIAPGEKFELPFGLDNHITVKRQVSAFKQSERGKKVRLEQTIEIRVENHDNVPRVVYVEENVPISRDDRVRVDLRNIDPEPTEDDDQGRLSWRLELEPGGESVINIPYRIEYPIGLSVIGL